MSYFKESTMTKKRGRPRTPKAANLIKVEARNVDPQIWSDLRVWCVRHEKTKGEALNILLPLAMREYT